MAVDPAAIEPYREYLHLLVRMQVAPALARRVDVSGVVQLTLWEATQSDAMPCDAEVLPWLRQILANNLRDQLRHVRALRRDVRREQSLESALEQSSARLEAWRSSRGSSPSQRAARNEELARLAVALASLPNDQRLAVELHHLHELPLSQVAAGLGRSSEAVASLLYRAMKRLKICLASSGDQVP